MFIIPDTKIPLLIKEERIYFGSLLQRILPIVAGHVWLRSSFGIKVDQMEGSGRHKIACGKMS